MTTLSEWDHRAPTLAEQVDHLRHTWDGPRCPHGTPLNAPGPDLICGTCEAEVNEIVMHDLYLATLDADGVHPHPIGPDRDFGDTRVRIGETRRIDLEDDLPF